MANEVFEMGPVVNGWIAKLDHAVEAKHRFQAVGDECNQFFSGATDFMYKGEFANRYFGGELKTKFKVTIAKAFELVALFGPSLYWNNPDRRCQPRKELELDPNLIQLLMPEMAPQIMQQEEIRKLVAGQRANLLQHYLNYTPYEQPGGGLAGHSELSITDALVRGRGCIWPEPYLQPGSSQVLTGGFFSSVNDLLIDPDAQSFGIGRENDAWWIARRCVHPVWWVEREYGWPVGSLKGKGHVESRNSEGTMRGGNGIQNLHKAEGRTQDLLVYWKIWSKCGVGQRLTQMPREFKDQFDRIVGDNAYLVVAAGVDFPLNAPQEVMRTASNEQVAQMFAWPTPFWRDGRWPVAVLDFYRSPDKSTWPIAPISQGLGELIFLNAMMSSLMNRVWDSQRSLIAVLKSAASQVKSQIESGDGVIVIDDVHKSLRDVISRLDRDDVGPDSYRMIDEISSQFEKRTGISELMSGFMPGGGNARTATEANIRQQGVQIRPEYMAGKVETWQTELARMEALVAYYNVSSRSILPVIGPVGASLWEQLVLKTPPEAFIRETDVTVAASSVRKPNKGREQQNLAQLAPFLLPLLDKHADATGDTSAMNAFIRAYGESIDQDTGEWQMGQRGPDEQQQQAMAEQQQLESAQSQAEIELKQAEVELKQIELLIKEQELENNPDALKALESAQQRLVDRQKHMQDQEQARQRHDQDLDQSDEAHDQSLGQDQESHIQDILQKRQQGVLKLHLDRQMGDQKAAAQKKVATATAAAAARQPVSNGNGNGEK